MPWDFALASNIGGRTQQQDRIGVLSTKDGSAHLAVVADGMGGHRRGAMAAQAVLDTAGRGFQRRTIADPRAFLVRLCLDSHRTIASSTTNRARSPGSTCALLYLCGPEAYWAHVGDSRVYHVRQGNVLSRTADHSVAQLMMPDGNEKTTGSIGKNARNQLYMRLGGEHTPEPDSDATAVEPEDLFILCSDGFWALIHPGEVITAVQTHALRGGAQRLVELAKYRGGDKGDNISLVLAQWRTPPQRRRAGRLRQLFPWSKDSFRNIFRF